ncbi:MAG TPA: exodeoxyribonuclease VII large subunit [Bacteroidales bacterium]|nr:exodeoxyribonuclease VII large subunit [Bacteroidales bacterium]
MPQQITNRNVFSLSEVAGSIRRTLAGRYTSRFWVKAEMSKLNRYDYSGHCYPDLIERADGRIVAQMRGIIWATDYRRIADTFSKITGEELSDGQQIIFEAGISFDPNHGLSLNIFDIDPAFTLGELEIEKRQCIQKLQSEGIWELNRSLPMPMLPKRIAVVSVSTSKGYADFISLINARSKGFSIQHVLFPAILQGEKAVEEITHQLGQIRKVSSSFDLVAIIRGGGGDTGLSAFNHYKLASTVATFPLPVITGIGHATNLTVTEMVANTRAITPSELADLLLERFEYCKARIDRAETVLKTSQTHLSNARASLLQLSQRLKNSASAITASRHTRLDHQVQLIARQSQHILHSRERQIAASIDMLQRICPLFINRNALELNHLKNRLTLGCGRLLGVSQQKIDALDNATTNLHPDRLLQKGFSITRLNGTALKGVSNLSKGIIIETQLAKGRITSKIIEIEQYEERTPDV